jgi:hypothetical protein
MAAILGCMTADPADPGSAGPASAPDRDQLAGATSSTNWPQEDAGSKVMQARVELDSQFRIAFFDTSGDSLSLSGIATIFTGKGIPVFHAPDSTRVSFRNATGISIPASSLPGIGGAEADSLVFSIRIQADSLQTLMTGFLYSKSQGKFIDFKSPGFSRSFRISKRGYRVRAVPDTSLPLTRLPNASGKAWCLYIPASPYYFLLDSARIVEIGPLPDGSYPLRLLQIGEPEGAEGAVRIRVYEVLIGTSRTNPEWNISLELGQKIDEFVTISSISIRS